MSEPIHDITPLGDLAEIVAGNIRAEVARFGLDQMEIAAALGTSQTAVSNRLNGKIRWQLDDIEALAGMLEIEPYELLIPPRTYKKNARHTASVKNKYTARDLNPEPIDSWLAPVLNLDTYLIQKIT